jgi:hypothetical protein
LFTVVRSQRLLTVRNKITRGDVSIREEILLSVGVGRSVFGFTVDTSFKVISITGIGVSPSSLHNFIITADLDETVRDDRGLAGHGFGIRVVIDERGINYILRSGVEEAEGGDVVGVGALMARG